MSAVNWKLTLPKSDEETEAHLLVKRNLTLEANPILCQERSCRGVRHGANAFPIRVGASHTDFSTTQL